MKTRAWAFAGLAAVLLTGAVTRADGPTWKVEAAKLDADIFEYYRGDQVKLSSGRAVARSPFKDYPGVFFQWQQTPIEESGSLRKLKISTFPSRDFLASEQFSIDSIGNQATREIGPLTARSRGLDNISIKENMNEIDILFSKFPPSAPNPPLEKLIFVSYSVSSNPHQWHNRAYHLDELPDNVEKVFQLSGFYRNTEFGIARTKKLKKNQQPPHRKN
jgi:hypothetical protein